MIDDLMWHVQLFELPDAFCCLSLRSRCMRCFWLGCRLERRHWAEQQSSAAGSWCWPGTKAFKRLRAALLLHADRAQRLRSHLMAESWKLTEKNSSLDTEQKKYRPPNLFVNESQWIETYLASAFHTFLFSVWWKNWMPFVTIFMDCVCDLAASVQQNFFGRLDCAFLWALITHQFRIMCFLFNRHFFYLGNRMEILFLVFYFISV